MNLLKPETVKGSEHEQKSGESGFLFHFQGKPFLIQGVDYYTGLSGSLFLCNMEKSFHILIKFNQKFVSND